MKCKQQKSQALLARIEQSIFLIRGRRVMLDFDLAAIYGVTTKRLNEQVKRNVDRFPDDFMFQLRKEELDCIRSQIATGSGDHRNKRFRPYVFTEHGAIMLANVLRSRSAVVASIQVVRAFVRLGNLLATNNDLAVKLKLLEGKIDSCDEDIKLLFVAIN